MKWIDDSRFGLRRTLVDNDNVHIGGVYKYSNADQYWSAVVQADREWFLSRYAAQRWAEHKVLEHGLVTGTACEARCK